MNILGKQRDLPFSRKSDRKKEKSTVSFTHEQNIICSQTQLDGFAHEQTIICRQLFAGHVLGSRSMKKKEKFASNDNYSYLHSATHVVYNSLADTLFPRLRDGSTTKFLPDSQSYIVVRTFHFHRSLLCSTKQGPLSLHRVVSSFLYISFHLPWHQHNQADGRLL